MFELKVVKEIKYRNFDKLISIKRANKDKNMQGDLYVGDIITVKTEDEAKYLCGENKLNFVACEIVVKEPTTTSTTKEKKTTKKKGDK